MFSTLIDSEPAAQAEVSPSTWGLSTLAHIVVVLAVVAMAGRTTEAALASGGRDVTYVDVAEFEERADPDASAPEPPAPEPIPAAMPEPPPEPAELAPGDVPTEQLAGFQELQLPEEVTGIPEPSSTVAVRAEDFRGRGIVGGIGGGIQLRRIQPRAEPAPSSAASTGPTALPPPDVVEENARILNADQLMAQLERLYPPNYRAAGIEGRVLAQFAVGLDGRVDPEGLTIIESSHPAFEEATRELLLRLRWRPARQNGRFVRSWVRMPVVWNVR